MDIQILAVCQNIKNKNKKSLFSKSQLYRDKTVNNNMDWEKGVTVSANIKAKYKHCTEDEA